MSAHASRAGRTSDAALNAKRRLTAALEARGGASAPRVGRPAQRALDDALGALDLRGLAETLMPDLPRAPAPAPAPPNPAGTAAASAAGAKPATGGVAGDEKDVGCAACGRVVRAMSGIEAGGKVRSPQLAPLPRHCPPRVLWRRSFSETTPWARQLSSWLSSGPPVLKPAGPEEELAGE